MAERLTACISGSFKFKPEIDSLIDEFADYGVTVLEPTKGWLYVPGILKEPVGTFKPLPQEVGMDASQVERRFLSAIARAHFVYLHNQSGYLGVMSSLELGFTIGKNKPIFAREPITLENFENDLATYEAARAHVAIATPFEAAEAVHAYYGTTAST